MFLHTPSCKKCLSQIITFHTARILFEAAIVFEYNLKTFKPLVQLHFKEKMSEQM